GCISCTARSCGSSARHLVNAVGKPDDRNGHVRFDEGALETERWAARGGHSPEMGRNGQASHALYATAPASYSAAADESPRGRGAASAAADRRGSAGTRAAVERAEDEAGDGVPGRGFPWVPAGHSERAPERLDQSESRRALSRRSPATDPPHG